MQPQIKQDQAKTGWSSGITLNKQQMVQKPKGQKEALN